MRAFRSLNMLMLLCFLGLALQGCGGGGGGGSSTEQLPATDTADFSGTWTGTYSGTSFMFKVTQSGNNLSIIRTTPVSTGIAYSGTVSGNTAEVSTYGNGNYMGYSTWTKTSSTTASAYLNSCTPVPGFTCGAANGQTLNLTKQLYSISGKVTVNGTALSGVTVSTGSASVSTDSSGNYTISSLDNGNVTLTPSKTGYTFTPASQTIAVNGASLTGKSFTAVFDNNTRFTKIDSSGNTLPSTATNWSCVQDNLNGLIWEVKTDDGGLRDKDWVYTAYSETGTNGNGICDESKTCNQDFFEDAVNSVGLCGHKDWRMPFVSELVELQDNSQSNAPYINPQFFPFTKSDKYWTTNDNISFANPNVWWVDFASDYAASTPQKAIQMYVRLVRP